MDIKTFLAVAIVSVVAQDLGYHSLVGIPVAKRIYKAETTSSTPSADLSSLHEDLATHDYYVGVVITVQQSFSICGSSLLSNTRALTAAHCWWDGWSQAKEFTLVFGSQYVFVGGTRINTKKVVAHDHWDPMSLSNDLAMIMFDHVPYSPYIQPVALPFHMRNVNFIGSLVRASGYGKSMPDSAGFETPMMQTNVLSNVIATYECINSTYVFMQRTLCTLTTAHTCIGHSGGPLVYMPMDYEADNRSVLIGVASFGEYGCRHNEEALNAYVLVSYYLDWISSYLRK